DFIREHSEAFAQAEWQAELAALDTFLANESDTARDIRDLSGALGMSVGLVTDLLSRPTPSTHKDNLETLRPVLSIVGEYAPPDIVAEAQAEARQRSTDYHGSEDMGPVDAERDATTLPGSPDYR